MAGKCWLFHDWRLAKGWPHNTVYEGDSYPEIGAQGYQCRRCGRRKIKKTGFSLVGHACAPGPWIEAVEWLNQEEPHDY